MSEGWGKGTVKRTVEQAVAIGLLPRLNAEKYLLLLPGKDKLGDGVPTKIRRFLDELKYKIKQDQDEKARVWRDESISLQESLDSKHRESLQQTADNSVQNNHIIED